MNIKKICLYYLLPAILLAGALFFIKENLNDSKMEAVISCVAIGFLLGIAFSIKIPSEEKVK